VKPGYRRSFFNSFALFFIISLPFLIVFSLGYNFSLANSELENSLTVELNTKPDGAQIKTKKNTYETPVQLKLPTQEAVELSIEKEGYVTEDYILQAPSQSNHIVRFRDLWMLPEEAHKVDSQLGYRPVKLLSQRWALLQKGEKLYMQRYSFGGWQGEPELVRLQNLTDFPEMSGEGWKSLAGNVFWNRKTQVVLQQGSQGQWGMYEVSLNNFFGGEESISEDIVSVVKLRASQFLMLTESEELWLWEQSEISYQEKGSVSELGSLTFLEKSVKGMTAAEDSGIVWLWRGSSIYRIEKRQLQGEKFLLEDFVYTESRWLEEAARAKEDTEWGQFVSKSVFLGRAFKVGEKLVYIPDSNSQTWRVLATEVKYMGSGEGLLMWLDENQNLLVYDFEREEIQYVESLDWSEEEFESEELRLVYSSEWERIMVYAPRRTWSLWYSNEYVNSSIREYNLVEWVSQARCLPKIRENYQFCLNAEKELLIYRNNSVF
jgi:hypothetical protein